MRRFGKARPSGEPSGSTERKIRILLELIRHNSVRLSRLADEYGASERSLLRDLQELRKIGERAGFTLSEKAENDRVRLLSFDHTLIREAQEKPRLLHVLTPPLREGSRSAETFEAIEAAFANNAIVTFRYGGKERRLEPARVVVRYGRYYLVGRDPTSRAWKCYALDAIEPPIKRAGSFRPEPIPEEYNCNDIIGFLQGPGEERVSVWISPALAPSVTARVWQRQQEIEMHADGSATLTFTVQNTTEVICWALSFGADAAVIAPRAAVERARKMARDLADAYTAHGRRRETL
jgi:predicted DNA-binding transcriptional regulator YafY